MLEIGAKTVTWVTLTTKRGAPNFFILAHKNNGTGWFCQSRRRICLISR